MTISRTIPLAALALALLFVCAPLSVAHAGEGDTCDTATPSTCGNGFRCVADGEGTSGTCIACARGNNNCIYTATTDEQTSPAVTNPANDSHATVAQGGTFANPLKANSLTELLTAILHGIVQLGSILLVLALVWVGFQFVAAQGAEEKIRDARNALFWTVVGGLILLGAEAISIVISSTVQAI